MNTTKAVVTALALVTTLAAAPNKQQTTSPPVPQKMCRDSQAVTHIYYATSDLREQISRLCTPGDLLMLDNSPHAVALFCDMTKPVIQQGRSTICTMLNLPRESR